MSVDRCTYPVWSAILRPCRWALTSLPLFLRRSLPPDLVPVAVLVAAAQDLLRDQRQPAGAPYAVDPSVAAGGPCAEPAGPVLVEPERDRLPARAGRGRVLRGASLDVGRCPVPCGGGPAVLPEPP